MLKFAIVGFGGLAKAHFGNIEKVKEAHPDIECVAICDIDAEAFTRGTEMNIGTVEAPDLSAYRLYTSAEELFANEELDFIISAIPTLEHSRIAVMAMEKGIHVFSEKPMARSLEQAKDMIDAAKKNNRTLMIGQCVRYFGSYSRAKEIIDSGEYGKVYRAEFKRLSMFPGWCWNEWYAKDEWSGGAALDLHVHDVDFINYIFGKPKAVTSQATNFDHIHECISTMYEYEDGKIVTCTGDWSLPKSYPFTAAFLIHMEKAALELRRGQPLTLYKADGTVEQVEIKPGPDGYVKEVVDFINCIKEGRWSTINNPDTAYASLEIAMAEKKSADTNEKVYL